MLGIGKNGYRKLANDVLNTARNMAEVIRKIPEFRLLHSGDGTFSCTNLLFESPQLEKILADFECNCRSSAMSKQATKTPISNVNK